MQYHINFKNEVSHQYQSVLKLTTDELVELLVRLRQSHEQHLPTQTANKTPKIGTKSIWWVKTGKFRAFDSLGNLLTVTLMDTDSEEPGHDKRVLAVNKGYAKLMCQFFSADILRMHVAHHTQAGEWRKLIRWRHNARVGRRVTSCSWCRRAGHNVTRCPLLGLNTPYKNVDYGGSYK